MARKRGGPASLPAARTARRNAGVSPSSHRSAGGGCLRGSGLHVPCMRVVCAHVWVFNSLCWCCWCLRLRVFPGWTPGCCVLRLCGFPKRARPPPQCPPPPQGGTHSRKADVELVVGQNSLRPDSAPDARTVDTAPQRTRLLSPRPHPHSVSFLVSAIRGVGGGKCLPSPRRCSDSCRVTRSRASGPVTWPLPPGGPLQCVPSRGTSPGARGSCSHFLCPVTCPAVSFIQQEPLSVLNTFMPVHVFNSDAAKSLNPQLHVKMLGLIEELHSPPKGDSYSSSFFSQLKLYFPLSLLGFSPPHVHLCAELISFPTSRVSFPRTSTELPIFPAE